MKGYQQTHETAEALPKMVGSKQVMQENLTRRETLLSPIELSGFDEDLTEIYRTATD